MSRLRTRYLDCSGMTMAEAEAFGEGLAKQQRDVHFQIGDLARYAEARWPDKHFQVWPEWVSPGLISRTAGVCKAYPTEEDRRHEATYSQYMKVANREDRQASLEEIVDKGQTTDESRKADQAIDKRKSWLLAIDVNYYTHRFWFSGAGVEAAMAVASWIKRTVERLKEKKLTDVACCFDSKTNHRKKLTEGEEWADARYKGKRGPKEQELIQQLQLVRELLEGYGFACISIEDYEADDCMASLAKQFPGKVTLMTQDKDLKQCLSDRVVMLRDVTWSEDETSGDMIPEYHWYTARPHSKLQCPNLLDDTGMRPDQFVDLQCLMGDSVDSITGAPGIGEAGAKILMQEFGTVAACIQAAHDEDERLTSMKRGKIMTKGLLELEPKLNVTHQLVKLRCDLPLTCNTRV